jgi:hypothetical protein
MAQLALTLAGGWAGGALAGGVGRAFGSLVGGYLGAIVEQELFGPERDPHEAAKSGQVSDIRIFGSAYGQMILRVWGRARLPANIIWLRGIKEKEIVTTEEVGGGGKGGGGSQTVSNKTFHNYADIALGICEGPVTSVYRIWVDNQPLDPEHVAALRIHYGGEDQEPDPLIQAVKGVNKTPAYRGLAYVVLEDFYLTPHGNRIPNFEVEVFRGSPDGTVDARHLVEGVCLIPASGEFAYDTDIVRSRLNRDDPDPGLPGQKNAINSHTGQKWADLKVAVDNLERELPNVGWINLVYAWFGTSLDVATCSIRPEAEYAPDHNVFPDTTPYLWLVKGFGRGFWPRVSTYTLPDGSTGLSYGGTVSDGSVVRCIEHLKDKGYKVLFTPFLLMDIPPPDPNPFPWRGRITGDAADVDGFFTRADGYLRFVRHCLDLCEDAGGVDGFVVGSEMVALNRIRAGGDYPAIPFWQQIAAEAKSQLGSGTIITYAADWSEYRYHDRGNGDVDFPLDALWADSNIDVIGIDAYFPLTDEPGSVRDRAAIATGWSSGELVDFYYASQADRDLPRRGANRVRTEIGDPFYAIKDLRGWWESTHVPRVNGIPTGPATDWVPQSKPIWFTEYGFASVNASTNRPSVFVDPKSAESDYPWYSNRSVDRSIQRLAVHATEEFWADPANNPVSPLTGKKMVQKKFLWTWDARPYPFFPALKNVWSDGENFRLGHWVQGKLGNMQLSEIVSDLCQRAGLAQGDFDVSDLSDEVVGYVVTERKAIREMIAVLQTAYFFDAVESSGVLKFVKRGNGALISVDQNDLGAAEGEGDRAKAKVERTQDIELPVAVDVIHLAEGRDYQTSTVTARRQLGTSQSVTAYSLPLVLSVEDAQAIAQAALREIWQSRVALEAKLPTRGILIDPTDVIDVPVDGVLQRFRITSVTYGKPGLVLLRGVATDGDLPQFVTVPTESGEIPPVVPEPVGPIRVELMDLPLMVESHASSAQSFYFGACPVGGGTFKGATLFRETADGLDFTIAATAPLASVIGDTVTALAPGPADYWDEVNTLEVKLTYGALESLPDTRILNGANGALIGDEIIQFATAELIGPSHYRLSRLLRGRLGTEHRIVTHPLGSRFVLLNPGRQVRPTFSVAGLGITVEWTHAPVPQGPTGDQAGSTVFVNAGGGLKPWSPVHVNGTRNPAGDLTITWVRRTRYGGWWLDHADVPLNEESERYEVDILDGATVVRTLSAINPTVTYTGAEQTADFSAPQAAISVKVYQLSAVVGRGWPASATL